MKNKSFTLSKVATATGFLLGAFALSVLAGTWTPPDGPPPGHNTDAPINVGLDHQDKSGSISLTGLSLGKTGTPLGTAKLDIEGTAITTGLIVNGLTDTNSLKVGGTDASRQNYVLTNDGTGVALWKSVESIITQNNDIGITVNITSWPRAWYIPTSTGENTPIPMRKIDRPNASGTYITQHDMGGCPPKAIMVGFDKNGAGNVSILCAAPTSADLPNTFNWNPVVTI